MHKQNAQILSHLKRGKEITPMEALNEYGCFRLAARVYELRDSGWPIECERRSIGNGRVIGVYSLNPSWREMEVANG